MSDIAELIRASIQVKVVEAFNSTPELVEKLIAAALSKEVNPNTGQVPGYHDKKVPYMEWLVGEEIRQAVRKCLHEYVEQHTEVIQDKVAAAIRGADFSETLAKTLGAVLTEAWRWNVDLRIQKDS